MSKGSTEGGDRFRVNSWIVFNYAIKDYPRITRNNTNVTFCARPRSAALPNKHERFNRSP